MHTDHGLGVATSAVNHEDDNRLMDSTQQGRDNVCVVGWEEEGRQARVGVVVSDEVFPCKGMEWRLGGARKAPHGAAGTMLQASKMSALQWEAGRQQMGTRRLLQVMAVLHNRTKLKTPWANHLDSHGGGVSGALVGEAMAGDDGIHSCGDLVGEAGGLGDAGGGDAEQRVFAILCWALVFF